jgi:hypothetical protein
MPFTCEEFQVFHFGVIVKLFSFLSCSNFFSSIHCIFKIYILSMLRSYGVKASEHE